MTEQGVETNGWEADGYWKVNYMNGNSTQVHVQRNTHGGLDPRCDDTGGAIRFYYVDGRRKILSYTAIVNAEYIPHDFVPAG